MKKQCGYVNENKGPAWKMGQRSGYIYENKDT
jgi:hypothetical protein